MKKLNTITAIIVMLVAFTSTMRAYKKESMDILVDGKKRNMVIFTPDEVTDNLPLMIVTHGMNQSPEVQHGPLDNESAAGDRLYKLVDKEKFIVCYLRSNGNMWDTGGTSDQRFVEQTIGEMYAKYNIDAHRVYWSGFSMGSMLMYHCMHNMTGKIAAFCPCSGIQFSEQPWNKVKGPINLIHCHAKDDSVFPLSTYDVPGYVKNMATVNGENTYTRVDNYVPFSGATPGYKETWENAQGYKVVLFMYNWGDHNPSKNNGVVLWNFCKNIRLENIDPIPEPEKPDTYTIDAADEVFSQPLRLNGKKYIVTDADMKNIWYVNNSIESPQNVRSGTIDDISANPFCWIKLQRVSNASCTTTGALFTIQMTNKDDEVYSLWNGSRGYLNTPPGTWCLFALDLNNQYGQDAKNYGLWKIDYEEGKGYTIMNVGASEAGEKAWIYPSQATPQETKGYVRFFSKLTKVETGISNVTSADKKSSQMYDIMGRRISNPQPGTLYILNGKKHIAR